MLCTEILITAREFQYQLSAHLIMNYPKHSRFFTGSRIKCSAPNQLSEIVPSYFILVTESFGPNLHTWIIWAEDASKWALDTGQSVGLCLVSKVSDRRPRVNENLPCDQGDQSMCNVSEMWVYAVCSVSVQRVPPADQVVTFTVNRDKRAVTFSFTCNHCLETGL